MTIPSALSPKERLQEHCNRIREMVAADVPEAQVVAACRKALGVHAGERKDRPWRWLNMIFAGSLLIHARRRQNTRQIKEALSIYAALLELSSIRKTPKHLALVLYSMAAIYHCDLWHQPGALDLAAHYYARALVPHEKMGDHATCATICSFLEEIPLLKKALRENRRILRGPTE